MKQRARRLVVSRSIEREPKPGGGHPFVPIRRYWRPKGGDSGLLNGTIGTVESFSYYESPAL